MDLSQYLETMKNLPERFSNLNFWRGVRKLRDKMVDTFEYVGEWGNGIEGEIDSLKGDLYDLSSSKISKFYASNIGENHITDSDNGKIQDMMIYGKSLQDGTPTPDNPIEIQSVVNPELRVSNSDNTLSQEAKLPYTLNAIPVSSGGNVTIDGQQYIADYVDIENKKLVRMVDKVLFDTNDNFDVNNLGVGCVSKAIMGDNEGIPIPPMQCSITNNYVNEFDQWNNLTETCICINYLHRLILQIADTNAETCRDYISNNSVYATYKLSVPTITDLTDEEVQAFKALTTYYPTTNISVNSEHLDGYAIFNYPISMENGWNYVKHQLNDTRDYIYDMDMQSAEAYVNSEYAVALIELEV